jgi:hypothetical protein
MGEPFGGAEKALVVDAGGQVARPTGLCHPREYYLV